MPRCTQLDGPQRSFAIPVSDVSSVEVKIAEDDLKAENLHLVTWTSSFVLARHLHTFGLRIRDNNDIPVLEFGAGTGLVGLTAARLLKRTTILSDLQEIVPGLRTNIDLNAPALKQDSTVVQCGSLDWREPRLLTLESGFTYDASVTKAQIILAADTIYDENHPELISRSILTWLARTSDARAILCYALRVAYLDQVREIWSILEAAGLCAEQEGTERADSNDWDDECLCEWVVWKWRDL